jgi:hypothetical protein
VIIIAVAVIVAKKMSNTANASQQLKPTRKRVNKSLRAQEKPAPSGNKRRARKQKD